MVAWEGEDELRKVDVLVKRPADAVPPGPKDGVLSEGRGRGGGRG